MPNQGAHILFGKKVIEACGNSVGVDAASGAFRLGTYGPDPLFVGVSAILHGEGIGTHKKPGRVVLDRMREGILSGDQACIDYAAGFFTHYALDRLCHPYILQCKADGTSTHLAIESCMERILAERGDIDMPDRLEFTDADCRAAAAAFRGVSPAIYKHDVKLFWSSCKYARAHTGGRIVSLPSKFIPRVDGFIPHAEPTPGEYACALQALNMMEKHVGITAVKLERYFEDVRNGMPLDPALNADFYGSYPTASPRKHKLSAEAI